MKSIGHVLGFPVETDEEHGFIEIGPGTVQLDNGVEVRYSGVKKLSKPESGTYRMYLVDGELQQYLVDPPGFSKHLSVRSDREYHIAMDTDCAYKRGVYSGGLVVIGQFPPGPEAATSSPKTTSLKKVPRHVERDKRICAKYAELTHLGQRNYVKEIKRSVEGADLLSDRRIRDIAKRTLLHVEACGCIWKLPDTDSC